MYGSGICTEGTDGRTDLCMDQASALKGQMAGQTCVWIRLRISGLLNQVLTLTSADFGLIF